jgi:hypothetical protein
MKMARALRLNLFRCLWIVAGMCFLELGEPARAMEESLDQLQVGTQTYKNVTVTTKSKDYIFILHSAGMTSIRISELPDEARTRLGYADLTPKPKTNSPTVWAKQTLSKIESVQVKGVEEKLATAWNEKLTLAITKMPPLTTQLITMVTAGLLIVYFFFCYCCMLICQKSGNNPSILVFVPVLQWFPLLRAAQMSRWWFVPSLIPIISLVPFIVWCVKIVKARRKSGWLAFWLLFPVTSLPAFLYLAFSNGAPEPKTERRHVQVMTLETA